MKGRHFLLWVRFKGQTNLKGFYKYATSPEEALKALRKHKKGFSLNWIEELGTPDGWDEVDLGKKKPEKGLL